MASGILTPARGLVPSVGMTNVLSVEEKEHVLASGWAGRYGGLQPPVPVATLRGLT